MKKKHVHCIKVSIDHAWCENCCYCQKQLVKKTKLAIEMEKEMERIDSLPKWPSIKPRKGM